MIDDVGDMYKVEKAISISGICTNCQNEKICDFIKGVKIFITNKNCAEKISDTELTVYSCDEYETEKDIIPESGICLYCKHDM